MRISVRKNDAGYREDAYQFVILLNGCVLDECFTADEETGEAWIYDRQNRWAYKEKKLTGRVEVKKMGLNS